MTLLKTSFLASICFLSMGGLSTFAAEKPNVLILFTDDQRADTIAAFGNSDIHTPNLDELARRGFHVSSAYCLGANMGAVCRPSRNMLLSGRTYFRWSNPTDGTKASNNAPALPNTLPAVFGAAGYETYHHGKRGNTAELIHRQFDHSHYLDDFAARWSLNAGESIVDDAIDFLGNRDRPKSPWLMYLAFATPHDPRMASPEALARYDADKLILPANAMEFHPFDNGAVIVRDEWTALWPRTPRVLRDQWHDYYAVISTIDANIGRLIAMLKSTGQYDNTIIVFTSDHGLSMGSHGLMGKQNVYEDGYKAPMVIAGPGVTQGSKDDPVYLMDLFPTLCELSRITVPAGLDGLSFAPMLISEAGGPRDSVLLSYTDTQRAVRNGNWKLVRYPKINKSQLFDLGKDPHEMNDMSDDLAQADRLESLMLKMKQLQVEQGDTLSLVSETPTPAEFVPPQYQLAEAVAPPLGRDKPGVSDLHSTTVVGWTGEDRGSPFTVLRPEGGHFAAIAVGHSRTEPVVVTGLRFDLVGKGGSDRNRYTIIAGDPDSRWMPLLDQINSGTQPVGIFGAAGNVIDRLGIILPADQNGDRIVPAIGGSGGDTRFEVRFGYEDSDRRILSESFQGFHGTITSWNESVAIESLGILFNAVD